MEDIFESQEDILYEFIGLHIYLPEIIIINLEYVSCKNCNFW